MNLKMKLFGVLIYLLFGFFWNSNSQELSKIKKVDTTLIQELEKMFDDDQRLRKLLMSKHGFTTIQKDSIWILQDSIDDYNTIRLIEIVKDYGFLNSSNSNCRVPIYAIFMHSPYEYKTQILELINTAKMKNEIDSAAYGLISWHINGRQKIVLKPDE